MIIEDDYSYDAGDRYVPQFTPLTLQVLASYSISRKILYDLYREAPVSKKLRRRTIDEPQIDDFICSGKCEAADLIKDLKLPRIIKEILVRNMEKTVSAIFDFIHHFAQKYGFEKEIKESYSLRVVDFEYFVWSGNGVVDYKKTDMNLLASGKLCRFQGFAIYCEYCMEYEILNAMLNSNEIPVRFRNCLITYWIFYTNNDLYELNFSNAFDRTDAAMAAKSLENSVTSGAFEFFWNRLDGDEQISLAVNTIAVSRRNCNRDSDPYRRQVKLLSVMSWHQQRAVLAKVPDEIILNFWLHSESPRSAMWAWKHSKELITDERFANVVKGIITKKFDDDESMQMLIKIWHSASIELKNRAVDMLKDNYYFALVFLCHKIRKSSQPNPEEDFERAPCQAAYEFLREFLSVKNAAFRMKFIIDRTFGFASCVYDPRPLAEIIKLCLPNPDQQATFKQKIANSKEMKDTCLTLFSSCCFNTLTTKLEFYLSNVEAIEKYARQLIQSSEVDKAQFVYEIGTWCKFGRFVEKIFAYDSSALAAKRMLVLSFVPFDNYHFSFGLDESHLHTLNEVVKSVLSDKEISILKQNFLKTVMEKTATNRKSLCLGRRGLNYILKFLSWCMDDNLKNILELENSSLPLDDVFDEIFAKFAALYDFRDILYDRCCMLDRLDKCLKRYLKNGREINEYKLKRIDKPDDFKIFEMLLNEKDESKANERFLKILLEWFFNDDVKAIEEFKAKNARFGGDS